MIAFLRFIGLMNAAIWLGAVTFFSFGARPASGSEDMKTLLGTGNFPFFSGVVEQIITERYFVFIAICAVVALIHLLAEWLYMGRPARKLPMVLLAGLLGLVLIGGVWIEPKIRKKHAVRYSPNAQLSQRESAAKSLRLWQISSQALNVLMLAGLVVYIWRVANPSDAPRFISSVKFRG